MPKKFFACLNYKKKHNPKIKFACLKISFACLKIGFACLNYACLREFFFMPRKSFACLKKIACLKINLHAQKKSFACLNFFVC
jgi:hypothetical protein